MARPYEKNVVCKIRPEELSFHGDKLKQTYSTLLSSRLVPGANYYATYAEFTEIPADNPTCSIHKHEVDQICIYIGKPRTFAVTYALVPPGKKVLNEFQAQKEDEYTLSETGLFFIPAGVRHNLRFDKVSSPVIEIGISMKGTYP